MLQDQTHVGMSQHNDAGDLIKSNQLELPKSSKPEKGHSYAKSARIQVVDFNSEDAAIQFTDSLKETGKKLYLLLLNVTMSFNRILRSHCS